MKKLLFLLLIFILPIAGCTKYHIKPKVWPVAHYEGWEEVRPKDLPAFSLPPDYELSEGLSEEETEQLGKAAKEERPLIVARPKDQGNHSVFIMTSEKSPITLPGWGKDLSIAGSFLPKLDRRLTKAATKSLPDGRIRMVVLQKPAELIQVQGSWCVHKNFVTRTEYAKAMENDLYLYAHWNYIYAILLRREYGKDDGELGNMIETVYPGEIEVRGSR